MSPKMLGPNDQDQPMPDQGEAYNIPVPSIEDTFAYPDVPQVFGQPGVSSGEFVPAYVQQTRTIAVAGHMNMQQQVGVEGLQSALVQSGMITPPTVPPCQRMDSSDYQSPMIARMEQRTQQIMGEAQAALQQQNENFRQAAIRYEQEAKEVAEVEVAQATSSAQRQAAVQVQAAVNATTQQAQQAMYDQQLQAQQALQTQKTELNREAQQEVQHLMGEAEDAIRRQRQAVADEMQDDSSDTS